MFEIVERGVRQTIESKSESKRKCKSEIQRTEEPIGTKTTKESKSGRRKKDQTSRESVK